MSNTYQTLPQLEINPFQEAAFEKIKGPIRIYYMGDDEMMNEYEVYQDTLDHFIFTMNKLIPDGNDKDMMCEMALWDKVKFHEVPYELMHPRAQIEMELLKIFKIIQTEDLAVSRFRKAVWAEAAANHKYYPLARTVSTESNE